MERARPRPWPARAPTSPRHPRRAASSAGPH